MEPNNQSNENVSLPSLNPNQIQGPNLEGPVNLLKSAWQLFKNNWKILVPIVIAPTVSLHIAQIFFLSKNPGLILVAFVLVIAGIILSVIYQPAAINAIHRLTTEPGVNLSIITQYKFGMKFFWSVVFLVVLQGIVFLGSFILLFIPAIIIGIYIGFVFFVLVLDGKKGIEALIESYSLVSGRWLKTLGRMLFPILYYIVGVIVITGLSFILSSLFGIHPKSAGDDVLNVIMNLVLSAALVPLTWVYMYNLYISLKTSRLPNVSTGEFSKLLTGLAVMGVIISILIPILVPIIGFKIISNLQMKSLESQSWSKQYDRTFPNS